MRYFNLALCLLALLLASCAKQVLQPEVLEAEGVVLEQAFTVPNQDALNGTPAESLLASADSALAQNKPASASRYLERAIQIAPRSSWLYKRMAELRLEEGEGYAAEGFARHALQNAPADEMAYRANLWKLLATCLAQQGKHDEAKLANDKADQLIEGGL